MPENTPDNATRAVILHYHLFKNAGTSVDAILEKSFPDRWVTREFAGNPKLIPPQVGDWIAQNPGASCFSSHTARFPVPTVRGVSIFPIIFIRHPLDRIRSAYEFERKQTANTFGSVLARNTTLRGYVETRLALKFERQCRNFQTQRLAEAHPASEGSELERALKAVAALPIVGLVEHFDESMQKIRSKLLGLGFGGIQLTEKAHNTSASGPRPVEESLDKMAADLGEEVYKRLEEANSDDLKVYELVKSNYATA